MRPENKNHFKNFKLKVAGVEWSIVFKPDGTWLDDTNDKHTYGMCEFNGKIIWLSTNQSKQHQIRTIWHELTHVSQRNDALVNDMIHIESQAESMAELLIEIIPQIRKKCPELLGE